MKIYRLSYTIDGGCSGGYRYYSSKREALAARRTWLKAENEDAEVCEIRIEFTKNGLLRALNLYASHPDNG